MATGSGEVNAKSTNKTVASRAVRFDDVPALDTGCRSAYFPRTVRPRLRAW